MGLELCCLLWNLIVDDPAENCLPVLSDVTLFVSTFWLKSEPQEFYTLYIILYYFILYYIIWYDIILYYMIWYDIILHDMTWYDIILHDMIWYYITWYDMILYFMYWIFIRQKPWQTNFQLPFHKGFSVGPGPGGESCDRFQEPCHGGWAAEEAERRPGENPTGVAMIWGTPPNKHP